jgi:hypothetical protein
MARRRRGRKAPLSRRGSCSGSHGRKISVGGYKRRKPGSAKSAKKTVSVSGYAFCSSRPKTTKRKASKKATGSRKACYTKTGLKKAPKANGRCPAGSNRSKANKAAKTGRKGGYSKKRKSAAATRGRRYHTGSRRS